MSSTKTLELSNALLAIGLEHEEAHGSMVLTLGDTRIRLNKYISS
jgi:cysteine sulfinate desulfinase/cysteine desulfurase-like protein